MGQFGRIWRWGRPELPNGSYITFSLWLRQRFSPSFSCFELKYWFGALHGKTEEEEEKEEEGEEDQTIIPQEIQAMAQIERKSQITQKKSNIKRSKTKKNTPA